MQSFKVGDQIERISGDARNRGVIIEIDDQAQRARIDWTYRQLCRRDFNGRTCSTQWLGEFVEFAAKQPRTWAAFKSLKAVK